VVLHHRLHDVDVVGDVYLLAAQFSEVLHGLRFPIGRNDDFHVFGKDFRQPKCDVALLSVVPILKAVDSFEDEDDFVVEHIQIFDGLIFDALVADIEPI
jgi:hypothetical protein